MRRLAVLTALLPACSYAAYTPPPRMMPLETADAPTSGSTDVQLEGSRVAAVMGADTGNGNLRMRHGITPTVAVEAEGGVLHVLGGSGDEGDRNAYLGRVGVHVHPVVEKDGATVALTTGVGSGFSSLAGKWVSADAGLIAQTDGTHAALFVSGEAWGSHPLDPQPFMFGPSDDIQHDVLSDTIGARATGGLTWWPKGRDSTALIVGASYGVMKDADDHAQVLALGAAVRAKL